MKKLISIALAIVIFIFGNACFAEYEGNYRAESASLDTPNLNINAKSFVLMEAKTGRILISGNEEYFESPASVTKIMTLLLVCEALENGKYSLNDTASISDHAASMGGSQVFLKEGERLTVEELIKCTVIASANDAAVALAELTEGSEAAFVKKMNEKAKVLALKKTSFENATGLDDTTVNHYSCAMDIAIMSRELIKYDIIKKYSSLWQDSIRNGEFILTNTNRLIRFYDGCYGLKTGSTDKAGYCISVTAKRNGLELIAVIMGSESISERNSSARTLLDYGFSSFELCDIPSKNLGSVHVRFGTRNEVNICAKDFCEVINKGDLSKIETVYDIPEAVDAPISKGDIVGKITYKLNGDILGESDIISEEDVYKISFIGVFVTIIKNIFK